MKKVVFLAIIVFLFFSVPTSFAAESLTMLKTADIQIKSSTGKTYQIVESVTLTNAENIQEGVISHTFSNLEGNKLGNLVVTSGGQELESEWEEGDALSKLKVNLPDNASSEFTYEIQYQLKLQEGSYTTPLFVPMYPTAGNENVVHINFTAPEGEQIHKNSFPVIIDEVENEVESSIMNIPSHVKYVYGAGVSSLNVFNIVSWGVILALFVIIATWFTAEINKKKGAAA
jgi:hypothetical protein